MPIWVKNLTNESFKRHGTWFYWYGKIVFTIRTNARLSGSLAFSYCAVALAISPPQGLCHVNASFQTLRWSLAIKTSIYSRHRFHPDIIRRAVWMYFRFNLSFRDVEELMIERGVDVSYETIRRWVDKFGSKFARRIKSRSGPPSPVWHLDKVYTKINGKMVYLWRAVDDEGTVLDVVVQRRRNAKAATRLLRKLLKNQGIRPTKIVTIGLDLTEPLLNSWA